MPMLRFRRLFATPLLADFRHFRFITVFFAFSRQPLRRQPITPLRADYFH
jgi:hypothetical protein